jgi:hypothetical protein
MHDLKFSTNAVVVLLALCAAGARAQQPERKPVMEMPSVRLADAKNVMVVRARGSNIPYDVISSTLEGWGRFTLVETPGKADLVVEVSTSGGESEVRVTSSSGPSAENGAMEKSNRTSKDLSNAEVKMTVYDARNKRVLWVATEISKSAMKQKDRENHLVEAAERLASKFHDRLEPPPAKDKN